jgi:minor fimbrial subunit
MKHNILKKSLALLVLTSGVQQALAEPVQVNISGKVIASPCTVDTANSNLNVNLGDYKAAELEVAGMYSKQEGIFNIALKDCPASTRKVTATFSGTADKDEPKMFSNTGTASGIAVKIKKLRDNWTDESINPNGGVWVADVTSITQSVNFVFSSTLYSKTGTVTPGTVNSTMQVTFTYQ